MSVTISNVSFGDDAFASGTSVTGGAFTTNATVGSILFALVSVSATSTLPSTVTDSASQSYTFVRTLFNAGSGNQQLSLYKCNSPNTSTAKLTGSATWAAAQTGKAVALFEALGASGVDSSIGQIQGNPGTGANAITSTTVAPTVQPGLAFGFTMETLNGNASNAAAGTGFSLGSFTGIWKYGTANILAVYETKTYSALTAAAATFTDSVTGGGSVYQTFVIYLPQASTQTPFKQTDWPTPLPARYVAKVDDQPVNLKLFPPKVQKPFVQTDWPAPFRPVWQPPVPDQQGNQKLFQYNRQMFHQYDWPNIPKAAYVPQNVEYGRNLLLFPPQAAQKPFVQTDWPNPAKFAYIPQNVEYGRNLLLFPPPVALRPFFNPDTTIQIPLRMVYADVVVNTLVFSNLSTPVQQQLTMMGVGC